MKNNYIYTTINKDYSLELVKIFSKVYNTDNLNIIIIRNNLNIEIMKLILSIDDLISFTDLCYNCIDECIENTIFLNSYNINNFCYCISSSYKNNKNIILNISQSNLLNNNIVSRLSIRFTDTELVKLLDKIYEIFIEYY
jgi:hypothetical protein